MSALYRTYGSTEKIRFVLLFPDGDLHNSATLAAGDFRIKKDSGGWADVFNLPVNEDEGWYSWTPTAAEMQAKQIVFKGYDATVPQDWVFQTLYIETGGHPASMWPGT